MNSPAAPTFQFESSDSLAQFSVWLFPFAGGGVLSIFLWQFGGWTALAGVMAACLFLIVGLRSSISVYPDRVKITRKWFFLPYRTYTASSIDAVSFGGDYGLEEGAICVVVEMAGREIALGTSKNMRYIYDSLDSITGKGRAV